MDNNLTVCFEQLGWINAAEVFQLETRRILESDGGVMTLEKECMVLDIRNNMEYLVGMTRRYKELYRAPRRSELSSFMTGN
jgi:hypothetical protein